MGASILACGAGGVSLAEVAFGGLENGEFGMGIDETAILFIANLDHGDVVVGAAFGAGGAADAGVGIDIDDTIDGIASDSAGWATDHADGIFAMHASVGEEPGAELSPFAMEARISLVHGSAGADAIIAASAFVGIDDHGVSAVDQALIDEEFEQGGFVVVAIIEGPGFGGRSSERIVARDGDIFP